MINFTIGLFLGFILATFSVICLLNYYMSKEEGYGNK